MYSSLTLYRLTCSTFLVPSCNRNKLLCLLWCLQLTRQLETSLLFCRMLCYISSLWLPLCPQTLVYFFEITPFTVICSHFHTWEHTQAAVRMVTVSMSLVLGNRSIHRPREGDFCWHSPRGLWMGFLLKPWA